MPLACLPEWPPRQGTTCGTAEGDTVGLDAWCGHIVFSAIWRVRGSTLEFACDFARFYPVLRGYSPNWSTCGVRRGSYVPDEGKIAGYRGRIPAWKPWKGKQALVHRNDSGKARNHIGLREKNKTMLMRVLGMMKRGVRSPLNPPQHQERTPWKPKSVAEAPNRSWRRILLTGLRWQASWHWKIWRWVWPGLCY